MPPGASGVWGTPRDWVLIAVVVAALLGAAALAWYAYVRLGEDAADEPRRP